MQWHNKFHLEMPKGLVNDLMVFVIIKVNIKYFSNGILLAVNININIGHTHKLQIL